MHVFSIYLPKAQYFAPNVSFVSNVKPLNQPITSNVTYDVGAPAVYSRLYWCKFLTLSNQTSRYIHKCIRMRLLRYNQTLEITWYARKIMYHGCLLRIEKIRPSGSLFCITRQSFVMSNSDPRTEFFYPHLTLMKDSYILFIRPAVHTRFVITR